MFRIFPRLNLTLNLLNLFLFDLLHVISLSNFIKEMTVVLLMVSIRNLNGRNEIAIDDIIRIVHVII